MNDEKTIAKESHPSGAISTEILDCPFCGVTPTKEPDPRPEGSFGYYIKIDHKKDCMICGINTLIPMPQKLARWNTRNWTQNWEN